VSALRTAALQLRTLPRVIRRGEGPLRARLGPLDDRIVFVIGSPRSGTTFAGASIGSMPGFVDLGEVATLKGAIPALAGREPDEAAAAVRRILTTTRRLGLVGSLRPVEQTPETAFVAAAAARAFPEASFVHMVRDGRDVVCSLLERGWLSVGRAGRDDAGHAFGAEPRFWVEAERRDEFRTASDARRAAWAWRRYVEAARSFGGRVLEVRYEVMTGQPGDVGTALAEFLGAPAAPLAAALGRAHAESVGRYRRDLTEAQLADVEAEAGPLLRELGYSTP
jgi:sulfotransferase family protein